MESVVKVVERYLISSSVPELTDIYGQTQLGLGKSGGLEIAYQAVAISLQEHPDWAVISSDRANAFNTFDRNEMARQIRGKLPAWLPYDPTTIDDRTVTAAATPTPLSTPTVLYSLVNPPPDCQPPSIVNPDPYSRGG